VAATAGLTGAPLPAVGDELYVADAGNHLHRGYGDQPS
jgi:hypothetical protein